MKKTLMAGVLLAASIAPAVPQTTRYQDSHYYEHRQNSHYYEHK